MPVEVLHPNPMGKEQSISIPFRRLEGKVAIVTGGARGIGEATVRLFIRHGAQVVIADIEDALGNALAASLSPSASYVHCDVSIEDDVQKLVDTTVAQHGKLDILFNNAALLGSQSKGRKSILNFDPDEFDRIMSVNVKGVALGLKHAARVMLPRQTGCIISTASAAGVIGGLGPYSYMASKHAVIGLTKNAACELGRDGIRVNCISPFGVATTMLINAWWGTTNTHEDRTSITSNKEDDETDADANANANANADYEEKVEKTEEAMRRLATLKGPTLKTTDIAEAALYLASDESKYVSGHNLVVDGGFTTSINAIGL